MMQIRRLAWHSPIRFALAATLAFIAMLITGAVLANRWLLETEEWYVASAITRVLASATGLALLYRLGWLQAAALTRRGSWQAWLLALLALAYLAGASAYAMSGSLDLSFVQEELPGAAALFIMAHALLEEIVFRGLVMVALLNVWGATRSGVLKSVVVSSLFFAGMHIINVLSGNPLPVVLLQSVGAFFLGILFCSLVLGGKSLYPAVFVHGIANIAGFLIFGAHPDAAGEPGRWLLQSTLLIPPAIFALYILGNLQRQAQEPVAAQITEVAV